MGCSVGYRVVGEWPDGFQGEITIRNTGATTINGWTLAFAFANGQTVTNMWGGSPTQNGATVSVAPASYTSTIPASGSVTVGFTAARGTTNQRRPDHVHPERHQVRRGLTRLFR